jgi:hypothetical protein
VFLDSPQPMPHGIGMTKKDFCCAAHRCIVVLPDPERFEENLALLVGQLTKARQYGAR